jgi:hypothetical protein
MGRPTPKEIEEARYDQKASPEALDKAYMKHNKTPTAPADDGRVRDPVRGQRGYAKGGSVSASKRADGIAQRGKTRGTMVMCGGGMAKGK